MATEVELAAMNSHALAEFMGVATCTWPPFLAAERPGRAKAPTVHPVLGQPWHVASMRTDRIERLGYLNRTSLCHRKLRRLPLTLYAQTLASSFMNKTQRAFRNHRTAGH